MISENFLSEEAVWPKIWPRLLSDASLAQMNAPTIFERGKTYARSGVVRIKESNEPPSPSAFAAVDGTQTYLAHVFVQMQPNSYEAELNGNCSCPSGEGGWFCKHLIATAIVWRAQLSGEAIDVDEGAVKKVSAAKKRAETQENNRKALHQFLREQSSKLLAEKLIEFSEIDPSIARELQVWRKSVARLNSEQDTKLLISEVLTVRGRHLDFRQSNAFAMGAQSIVALLGSTYGTKDSVALCLHAIRRIWAVMEKADDSLGSIGDLAQQIIDCLFEAIKAHGPQNEAFGDIYFKLALEDPYSMLEATQRDAEIGPAAQTRFRKLVAKKWQTLKTEQIALREQKFAGKTLAQRLQNQFSNAIGLGYDSARNVDQRAGLDFSELWQVERLYMEQLEQQGDVETLIAVLKKGLDEPNGYIKLSQYFEQIQRPREALANLEQGFKEFPNDIKIIERLIAAYERDGWPEEVFKLNRQRYFMLRSVDGFFALIASANAAGEDPVKLRDELIHDLKKPLGHTRFRGMNTLELLADIFLHEKNWKEVIELCNARGDALHYSFSRIARALPIAHSNEATHFLKMVLNGQLQHAQAPYLEPLKTIKDIAVRMDSKEAIIWLSELTALYKQRKKLVEGIQSVVGDLRANP